MDYCAYITQYTQYMRTGGTKISDFINKNKFNLRRGFLGVLLLYPLRAVPMRARVKKTNCIEKNKTAKITSF